MDNILELINRRERQILVHSILYYHFNDSIWEDRLFDRVSLELVKLGQDYPEEFKQSELYEHFKTFDGTTGYDLPLQHQKYWPIANALLFKIRGGKQITYKEFYDYDIDKYLGL